MINADLGVVQCGAAYSRMHSSQTLIKNVLILTLSPGGPGGPSLPEVPCRREHRGETGHKSVGKLM